MAPVTRYCIKLYCCRLQTLIITDFQMTVFGKHNKINKNDQMTLIITKVKVEHLELAKNIYIQL
jgi:hypothetical protein